MNLGKDVQMEIFKTNIAPEEQHEEGMSQNDEENNQIDNFLAICVFKEHGHSVKEKRAKESESSVPEVRFIPLA